MLASGLKGGGHGAAYVGAGTLAGAGIGILLGKPVQFLAIGYLCAVICLLGFVVWVIGRLYHAF